MKRIKIILVSILSILGILIISGGIYFCVAGTTTVHCDVFEDRVRLYSNISSEVREYTIYYKDIESIELIDKPNTRINADTSDYDNKFNVEVGLMSREDFGLYFSMVQKSRKKAIQIVVKDGVNKVSNKFIFSVALFTNMDSLYEEICDKYSASQN